MTIRKRSRPAHPGIGAFGALLALLSAGPAFAAPPSTPPSGTVGQQQLQNTSDRAAGFASQGYVPSQDVPPQLAGVTLTPAQQHMTFQIADIVIEGSTVFRPEDFKPLTQSHIGRQDTLADIYGLSDAIAAKYHSAGYPFTQVRVPGQRLANGRLVVRVTEFSVGEVDFMLDGHPVPTPPALQPVVARILATQPVRTATLEAAQAAAASMRDMRFATARLQPLREGKLRMTVLLVRPGDTGIAIQPTLGAAGTGAAAGAVRIDLRQIHVVGGSTLTTADLAPIYADALGHVVTLGQLHDIARRIADRYVAAGHFGTTADVPPQVVHDGVVTIEVRELIVNHVQVHLNGNLVAPGDLLYDAANAIAADKPVLTASVQRQLYVLNHIPGVLVQSVIPPVVDDPAADVYLTRKPITFTTAMDNRGSSVAGPLEIGAMVQEDGQLGLNEEIQLMTLKPLPLKELTYAAIQWIQPLTSSGLVGTFMYSKTEAYPGAYLASSDIAALGDMVSLGLSYPIVANVHLSSLFTVGFDLFNNSSSALGGTLTTSDERSRAANIGFLTTINDSLGGVTTARTVYTQGIDGLGARPNGDLLNARPGIKLNAGKFLLDIRRDQPLPLGLQLSTGLKAQRALAPLPAAQVMTFGGVDFGRAYDSGIISGDSGVAWKMQLSKLIPTGNAIVPVIQPYAFYDIGEMWSAIATPGFPSSASAASTGIGVKILTSLGLGGSAEVDFPLTHGATVQPGETSQKTPRVFFLVFAQF
ncbi:POTRA domain-containing protein [Acidisphaera sp. S103]|uniref:POTRA domain-containing protein n=1 Tax=Acidisphaera sp. S103 TaxID=1747223 RepID=UPI00131E5D20|nr:POTRA domain-containing protein [Acidisphaera sp. S103]